MEDRLIEFLLRTLPDADEVVIEGFAPIPGGFSRETYRFDARVRSGGDETVLPFILRKDPPREAAILHTSRAVEHHLIEAIRANTDVPVSQSYGYEMDPEVFGEPAMVIGRMHGSGTTSDLFNGGPDEHQVDEVVRHLCEVLVALHSADISAIDPHGSLADPRGVGIDASTWDTYMDTSFEYYINSYPDLAFDPTLIILLDSFLTLRRNKPRPMPLAVIHGDFNPANFLYADGKVTALIDWENSRIGDPREDLGWMMTMDILSNTAIMQHPRDEGGFLAYYNKLRGLDITAEELDYFTLFGTANVAVPVNSAVARRVRNEHQQFLHLYLIQASSATIPNLARMLNYPGVSA